MISMSLPAGGMLKQAKDRMISGLLDELLGINVFAERHCCVFLSLWLASEIQLGSAQGLYMQTRKRSLTQMLTRQRGKRERGD